jgi:uncharacterized protein YbbK (DUF523 family)
MTDSTGDTIRIGVSACLLGEAVRYDGQSKPCAAVRELLAARAELVGICPEVEVGMAVPREAVDLFGEPETPRMVGAATGEDWTARMNAWARGRVADLLAQGIAGAVLKARSPSCGIGDAAVHREAGGIPMPGDGLFALVLRRAAPGMPVVRDEDLVSENEVENFLERARSYAGGRSR